MAEARFIQPRGKSGKGNAGSFLGFEQEVKNLVRKEALEFQAQVAERIDREILRPKDSTGRLVAVTQMPGNHDIGSSVWRVGIKSFLDKSDAKYARTIEFGSLAVWRKPFRGTPLRFIGDGPNRPFRSFPKGTRPGATTARSGKGRSSPFRGAKVVYVTKEIDPMHAYKRTFEENHWEQRIRKDFSQVIKNLF
jgi:hypothetical protein